MRTRSARPLAQALLLAFSLLGPACAADPGTTRNHELHGAWHWTGSYGGIAGISADPESEGYEVTFYFRRDGSLDVFLDGERESNLPVTVTEPPDTLTDAQLVLRYSEPLGVLPFVLGIEHHAIRLNAPDTLVLVDPCCYRFEHVFVR